MTAAAVARANTPAGSSQPRLYVGGQQAFSRLFELMAAARESIVMRCFDWRDDPTGNEVAEHLLAAADRGVEVTVYKDRVGAAYEYFEGSMQSFLHKNEPWITHFQALFLKSVYGKVSPTRQHKNALADAFVAHPNVSVYGDDKRFDHSKVYTFDDRCIFLGGMGIGDDFQYRNLDFMVEAHGEETLQHYHRRNSGRRAWNADRSLDFIIHNRAVHGRRRCPALGERLRLLASAQHRLTIEMAYLGDTRFTEALVNALHRGVDVTLVTGERANVLGDLNRATCHRLLQRHRSLQRSRESVGNLRVALHQNMVHSKIIVADGARLTIGSANFTPISHGTYDEVDLYLNDPDLAQQLEHIIEAHVQQGSLHDARIRYNPLCAAIERAIVAYQGRCTRGVPPH